MRIKLPKGFQIEIELFVVVAIVLAIASVVVVVVDGIFFGLTSDVDAFLVGWGSSSVVAALTGYVIFRLTGGSLKAAPRAVQRIIGIYFWGGTWFLVAAVTAAAMDQGGAAAFHLAANSVAPATVVSLVLGVAYLGAAAD